MLSDPVSGAVRIDVSCRETARPVRAVLFDLDGTLYFQAPVRLLMALELLLLLLTNRSPMSARTTWRAIRTFRKVREELRAYEPGPAEDLVELQFIEAAKRIRADRCEIEQIVSEWIFARPLKYLRLCRRRGLEPFLSFLEQRGIAAGVLSDYPVAEKLRALGLSDRFSITLCTTEQGINAFKPHPRGFLRACELWGLFPEEVLYVGDRPEVDAVGAAAAGMPCAILSWRGRFVRRAASNGYVATPWIPGLKTAVDSRS